MSLSVVILAAGKGTRMHSSLPKVLHKIGGKAMVNHVIDTARVLGSQQIHLVYGFGGERLQEAIQGDDLNWVYQAEQLGTGHAMQQAAGDFVKDDTIIMLYGDTPLVQPKTLERLIAAKPEHGIALLTVEASDPTGYGRIVRDENQAVCAIVEHKDANEAQRAICEVNTGIMALSGRDWQQFLAQLSNNNAQHEYYVTDVIALAVAAGREVESVKADSTDEVAGVNSRVQQAHLERAYQRSLAHQLLVEGVSLADPQRFDLRGTLSHGSDCFIDVNCVFSGHVQLGNGVTIGANCVICDSVIGDGVEVKSHTVLEGALLEAESSAGPFARMRPGAQLAPDAHIGNFVEMKKSILGAGSKCGHLSYLGDATVGQNVNIGAGTITCNYDGVNKFKTEIGDGAFIGSDSQLIAPVCVGENATIGAGSTITKDAPANQLTLTRSRQCAIPSWKRPVKK